MLAADMGARVIKIEHPVQGDDTRAWGPPFIAGESAYFLSINRNKESVAIDFKTARGRELLDALIAKADVIVENFRPGTLERHGPWIRGVVEARPAAHLCLDLRLRPDRDRDGLEAGYDAVAQAEGGLMSITGTSDGPPVRLGVAVADIASGMFAFQGLLLALIARGTSGRGQHVDVSLLDSVTALLTYQAARQFATGETPVRTGNRHMTIAPYDTFDTADGVLVLAVGNDAQWRKLCAVLGAADLTSDTRFATNAGRVDHYAELRPTLESTFERWRLDALVAALKGEGVPCGAVRSIADVTGDPQILARGMVETVMHPTAGAQRVLGIPVKLSDTPGHIHSAPPLLGQHTASVLTGDLGLSDDEVDALARAGVVRRQP